jgi:choline dehydrogenase-like flavoprotein
MVHWAGASLRFQDHEFKTRSVYGDIQGANLLDWPITLQDLEPYYEKAESKMGVTRTNNIPGLPGNNNFKVLEAGAKKLGIRKSIPGVWRSIRNRGMDAAVVNKSAFAFKAANPAPSGRL